MKYILTVFLCLLIFSTSVLAVNDPRAYPNNKFGLGTLSPASDSTQIANIVNAGGDWGWVVVVINKNDRDLGRWQEVFNKLNEKHLIPVVRIATSVDSNGNWQKPSDDDAKEWAQFLSDLYWPTQNKYVQVYNEVNHAAEWGGHSDPSSYAIELDKTINFLKLKDPNFFILNAPLDLALGTSTDSLDAGIYYKTMAQAVPGIFNKLDGWASHSYPNPDFSAPPQKSGRTGIDGYKWELLQIGQYTNKDLPVFITETGWKRGNSNSGLSANDIASYYKFAYENIWKDSKVVAVAPFLFDYSEELFRDFSFMENGVCLKYCETIANLPKAAGNPLRIDEAQALSLNLPNTVLNEHKTNATVEIKNTGNYIWSSQDLKLAIDSPDVVVKDLKWDKDTIYPGQIAHADLQLQTLKKGGLVLNFKVSNKDSMLFERTTQVDSTTYQDLIFTGIKTIFNSLAAQT